MYKIMIIEDDEKLRSLTGDFLSRYGYNVATPDDFKNIEETFESEKPDMVLLDINLPYYDGFYLCRVFRRKSKIPIIIMSARSGEMEQVMGMELGADDYVTKPFSSEVLLAKVKAALRRAYGEYVLNEEPVTRVKDLVLDENSFKILFRGTVLDLSKNEFKLVRKLLENKDRIVSREILLEELWDDSAFVDDNTLTVNVTRIKSKFQALGISDIIKTKRGAGYFFDSSALEDNLP